MSVYDLPPGPVPPGAPQPDGLAGPGGGLPGLGGGVPPGLAAMLQQPQGAPQADPLSELQDAIHAVVSAMASLPGAQDTQDAAQALLVLSRIQTRLMQQGSQGAAGG